MRGSPLALVCSNRSTRLGVRIGLVRNMLASRWFLGVVVLVSLVVVGVGGRRHCCGNRGDRVWHLPSLLGDEVRPVSTE